MNSNLSKTTNVRPEDLNYDSYTTEKYDRDIINSIPFHRELHKEIVDYLKKNFKSNQKYEMIDLGTGTGITARIMQDVLPSARFDLVDFSEQMMSGARQRFGDVANYLLGDYATMDFTKKYDAVVAVIGVHHQTHTGKRELFKKIYSMLKPGGTFIFGDLVTYRNPQEAALKNAQHFHHLVEHAEDEQTLKEWAHHHQFLNQLAPVEDQIEWLQAAGFMVEQKMLKFNTALLIAKKP